MTNSIENAIQSAEILAGQVFDALANPADINLPALTNAANAYLDIVKATNPAILGKAYALAMAVIDQNLKPSLDRLKRASRDYERERLKTRIAPSTDLTG
jgi:hypothetical protein